MIKRHISNLGNAIKPMDMKDSVISRETEIQLEQQMNMAGQSARSKLSKISGSRRFLGDNIKKSIELLGSAVKFTQSKEDDDDVWFEIHKEAPSQLRDQLQQDLKSSMSCNSFSSQSLSSEQSSPDRGTKMSRHRCNREQEQLTYQEIMMFIKFINVFEERKYQS